MSKLKFIVFAVFLVVLGYKSQVSMAASLENQEELEKLVAKMVNERTQALQNRVNELESEVKTLKQRQRPAPVVVKAKAMPRIAKENAQLPPPSRQQQAVEPPQAYADEPEPFSNGEVEFEDDLRKQADFVRTALYLGGTPVFSGPYIGTHSEFDGTDLIVNAPTVNLDLRLLKQTKALETRMLEEGVGFPTHPILDLSGKIEGVAAGTNKTSEHARSDLDLASAELDIFAQVGQWVQGFMVFAYDNSPLTPFRVSNSRIFLEQGFVTLGNLNRTSIYSSIGQLFVPYGRFSSFMLSASLAQNLGRTVGRAVVLGHYPMDDDGLYAAGFLFRGDTDANRRRAGGGAIGYTTKFFGALKSNLSFSTISDLANSAGMQFTGAPGNIPFQGFAEDSEAEETHRAVPAIDVNWLLAYGPYNFIVEYVGAVRSFKPEDMTYNNHGASPSALHLEGAYTFECHNKPGSFYIGYDHTRQALALFYPRNRYLVGVNYSFIRYTLASLEYRHDVSYGANDFATGADSDPFNQSFRNADMIALQFSLFF